MNNLICVFASEAILNPEKVKVFDKLSLNDSVFFYSSLLANYIELLMDTNQQSETIFFINKHDQQFVPKSFFPKNINFHFTDFINPHLLFENLDKNIFINYTNIILIHSKTMGIRKTDILRIFGLLAREEESIVIGKSFTDGIVFSAHNKMSRAKFESFLINEVSFEKHLSEILRNDSFVSLMEKFLSFSTFIDFKNLYRELSTKDSLNYCSEQMHERFTNLFIEYKDQLK